MNCARIWTDKFEERFHCTSEMLREWLFVTLQYVVISRKLDICNYDTQRLKNLINNLGEMITPIFAYSGSQSEHRIRLILPVMELAIQ